MQIHGYGLGLIHLKERLRRGRSEEVKAWGDAVKRLAYGDTVHQGIRQRRRALPWPRLCAHEDPHPPSPTNATTCDVGRGTKKGGIGLVYEVDLGKATCAPAAYPVFTSR